MFEAPPRSAEQGSGNLDFLRNQPQWNLIKHVAQRRPDLFEQLFMLIGRSHPQWLSLISANQAEFARLLEEPIPTEEQASLDMAVESLFPGASAEGGPEADPEGRMPGRTEIMITEEEQQQIERLASIVVPMGLNRNTVVEAWLACDKNEELAANYLLNSMDELMRDEGAEDEANS